MLIDAFTYFNEKELVELRLKYLNSIVDYFVVIESNITFTGKEKKWNFPDILKNNLKEFSHKIQYHQLNIKLDEIKNEESWIIDNIKGDDFWRIENFQRNYIKTACKKFSKDDILIISDLDEIPSTKKLNFILSSDFANSVSIDTSNESVIVISKYSEPPPALIVPSPAYIIVTSSTNSVEPMVSIFRVSEYKITVLSLGSCISAIKISTPLVIL